MVNKIKTNNDGNPPIVTAVDDVINDLNHNSTSNFITANEIKNAGGDIENDYNFKPYIEEIIDEDLERELKAIEVEFED